MSYLVDVLRPATAADAAEALTEVFTKVTSEVLGLAEPAERGLRFDELRRLLNRRKIGISDWEHSARLLRVNGGQWDRGEVETNLRQIEIIVLALRSPVLASATNVKLNPTQQSGFDASGQFDTD